jgi:uncharacterized protein
MSSEEPRQGPPRTIAVSGATGLIGSALVERLRRQGHSVRRLVRQSPRAEPGDVVWDPAAGRIDAIALEGVDAVVHLAGEPIAQRWTPERKRAIRDSRVLGTALLARTLASLARPPRALVSGSAVGVYGDRGDEVLDERSPRGAGFLADVGAEWENATAAAVTAGIRVVMVRTGVVLSARGGALAKLLPPFRLGLGGPIGSGKQWMSWIALEDQLRALELAMSSDVLHGPVNLTAPNPVTNATFASTLGHALHRPAIVPVPAIALELMYGEMARETILAGQRVLPRALLDAGFVFRFPLLRDALMEALED